MTFKVQRKCGKSLQNLNPQMFDWEFIEDEEKSSLGTNLAWAGQILQCKTFKIVGTNLASTGQISAMNFLSDWNRPVLLPLHAPQAHWLKYQSHQNLWTSEDFRTHPREFWRKKNVFSFFFVFFFFWKNEPGAVGTPRWMPPGMGRQKCHFCEKEMKK